MCSCTSCEYTDGFSAKGFAEWPRGEPAGKRSSESAYAAHWRHCNAMRDYQPLERKFPQRFPYMGAAPIQRNATAIAWNQRQAPVRAPARPAQPGKAEPHFPNVDRHAETTARIYDMAKERRELRPKRPRGRPAIDGRRILVKLEDKHIQRAKELAGGGPDAKIAEGIRKALGG
jgi:hypothetical protein